MTESITFNDLGLAETLLQTLNDEGYANPTPIQAQAIPALLTGRDLVGIAQTGTGKTAAFVLPQLHRLAEARKHPKPKSAAILIMAPTRELATQIADAIKTYGRGLRPTVAVVIGGVKPGPQVRTLARGVDFLVATPGRLLDHLQTGAVMLNDVQCVVLDEADQMLDLGFMPTIRKLMRALPAQRQTLLFSATMPKQIRQLANDFLSDPQEVSVTPASKPIERIDQKVVFLEKADKPALLAKLLKDPEVERAVVFARTKHGSDKLCRQLGKAGVEAQAIHGNKSQNQRQRTLDAFRDGSLSILVATDIAARGIDIDEVSHVFNYELPNVPEVYVHRIGRTARAGRSGRAIAFCDGSERPLLKAIEKLTRINIPVMAANDVEDFAPRPRAAVVRTTEFRRTESADARPTEWMPATDTQLDDGERPAPRQDAADAPRKPRRNRRNRRDGNPANGNANGSAEIRSNGANAPANGEKAAANGSKRRGPAKPRRDDERPNRDRSAGEQHADAHSAKQKHGRPIRNGVPNVTDPIANQGRRKRRKPAAATPPTESGLQRMLGNIGSGA